MFASVKSHRRRRRLLAEVMFAYTTKARCFARIKLFNYIHRNILAVVGYRRKTQIVSRPQNMNWIDIRQIAAEGIAKLRLARKKHFMRKALCW